MELKEKNSSTVFPILISLSVAHFLNDGLQAVIPAIYPKLKTDYDLSFTQIGLITLTFQLTASILQPLVGYYTDKKAQPYSLAVGMCFTLCGLLSLAFATTFYRVLFSVALIGTGSSVFHPESSRIARWASGGRAGLAQSLFQVGGNAGTSFGPLVAAAIIVPFGQHAIAYLSIFALLSIFILMKVGKWYKNQNLNRYGKSASFIHQPTHLSNSKRVFTVVLLMVLIFSKFFYMASMQNYLTFYMIHHFGVSIQSSQLFLFVFLFAVASGTIIGGPIGDKYGRKKVILFSIFGITPFALLLPHTGLILTSIMSVFTGAILASAFPAIIVYGQELFPEKLGLVSGLFYGFAFGMGAIGSSLLGLIADKTSIEYVFQLCSYLPLLGLVAVFLPDIEKKSAA